MCSIFGENKSIMKTKEILIRTEEGVDVFLVKQPDGSKYEVEYIEGRYSESEVEQMESEL